MHPAWAWASEHWFLTFLLAMSALSIVKHIVKGLMAPLRRLGPSETPPAPTPSEATPTLREAEPEEFEPTLREPDPPPRRRPSRSRFDRF